MITPAGQGGIGAIRIAGPRALTILEHCFRPAHSFEAKPFLMRYGHLLTENDEVIDETLAVFMPAGRSYTGLDQVEIYCHGGHRVMRRVLDQMVEAGARPAEPGEFTRLAFLNGRIDLAKAEAVGELIAASTEAAYRAGREHLLGEYSEYVDSLRERLVALLADIEASIDFAEDEVQSVDSNHLLSTIDQVARDIEKLAATYSGGRIIREGYKVVLWGRPNAGKSSLFNVLLRQERALVDPEAGTTRDYLSEWIDLEGYAVNLIDTAGSRHEGNRVEQAGQTKSRELADQADLMLWMADVSVPDWQEALKTDLKANNDCAMLLIGNKIDLLNNASSGPGGDVIPISCHTGEGLGELHQRIVECIADQTRDLSSGQVVTSARHRDCLALAAKALDQAKAVTLQGESAEIVAFELRRAVEPLAEITGQVYTEEILEEIFSRFCIGK